MAKSPEEMDAEIVRLRKQLIDAQEAAVRLAETSVEVKKDFQKEIKRLAEYNEKYRERNAEWMQRAEDADAEVERLRAKNAELNRRATKAEAFVGKSIDQLRAGGFSLGRSLANAGYAIVLRRAEAAEARIMHLHGLLGKAATSSVEDKNLLAERYRTEVDRLRQGIWDMLKTLGFDTDGDPTPAALVTDIVEVGMRIATQFRADYDEALDEIHDAPIFKKEVTDEDERKD